jgi:4-hydroxybenzoate polyprenyltransferase
MDQQTWAEDWAGRTLAPPVRNRALVIDLEGALLRSGLLMQAVFDNPGRLFACLRGVMWRGIEAVEQVLDAADIDYAHLPYETDVLNLSLTARTQGRAIYIAAGRFPDHAVAIATHLGFDGVVSLADVSTDDAAMESSASAPPFDGGRFEYVGDGRSPEGVWRAASAAYVVGGSDSLLGRLKALNPSLKRIGRREVTWLTWLNALRVYQYAKNTLVFVPALTSHQMNMPALASAFLAFLAFSACASSAYLVNDLFDLADDRRHPAKRYRAIASGDLPISLALVVIPALWIISAIAGLCISGTFFLVLSAYLMTTIAYSLYLKKNMLVDIVTLAGLYTVRIVGGAVAISVHLSEWLLIFSLFIFTSLALIKRYGELMMRQESDLQNPVNRDYKISDLPVIAALAAASGMNAITVFSLYASSPTVEQMYSRPWMLWLLNPLLLYWIGRALMMAHRQAMPDDPIIYTFTDRVSRATVAAMMCIVLAAI